MIAMMGLDCTPDVQVRAIKTYLNQDDSNEQSPINVERYIQ